MNTTILMEDKGGTVVKLDFYEGFDKARWLEDMADNGWMRVGEIWE